MRILHNAVQHPAQEPLPPPGDTGRTRHAGKPTDPSQHRITPQSLQGLRMGGNLKKSSSSEKARIKGLLPLRPVALAAFPPKGLQEHVNSGLKVPVFTGADRTGSSTTRSTANQAR